MEKMGVGYLNEWERLQEDQDETRPQALNGYYAVSDPYEIIPVTGYDFVMQVGLSAQEKERRHFDVDGNIYSLILNLNSLEFYRDDQVLDVVDLNVIKDSIGERGSFKFGDVVFEDKEVKFIFRSLSGVELSDKGEVEKVDWVDGVLLIKDDEAAAERIN